MSRYTCATETEDKAAASAVQAATDKAEALQAAAKLYTAFVAAAKSSALLQAAAADSVVAATTGGVAAKERLVQLDGRVASLTEELATARQQAQEAETAAKQLLKGSFNFNDFLRMLEMVKGMGPIKDLMKMMHRPGRAVQASRAS